MYNDHSFECYVFYSLEVRLVVLTKTKLSACHSCNTVISPRSVNY